MNREYTKKYGPYARLFYELESSCNSVAYVLHELKDIISETLKDDADKPLLGEK